MHLKYDILKYDILYAWIYKMHFAHDDRKNTIVFFLSSWAKCIFFSNDFHMFSVIFSNTCITSSIQNIIFQMKKCKNAKVNGGSICGPNFKSMVQCVSILAQEFWELYKIINGSGLVPITTIINGSGLVPITTIINGSGLVPITRVVYNVWIPTSDLDYITPIDNIVSSEQSRGHVVDWCHVNITP